MGCDCAKVERTPLWSAVPEYRQPTEIQKGENIECYAKRSGSPSGQKNDIGSQPINKIKNTSFTSSLSGTVSQTFELTPNSTPTGTVVWQFVIDGINRTNTTFLGIYWDSSGVISGTVDDASANVAYQVLASASDDNGSLDSRGFTFFPKKNAGKGETIKFVMPLIGGTARVTCAYGPRTPPAPGASSMHNGIDLALTDHSQGTIVAAADGVVVKAGPATGFGNWVVIEHYDSSRRLVCTTVYGHMKTIFVNVGDKVAAGQKIALEGNEGIGSGMHLHFEIHKGQWRAPTDPVPYLDGTIDVANNNDPNVEGPDGTPEPTGYDTVVTSDSGMTTDEGNATNKCPGDADTPEVSPGVDSGALPEDTAIDDRAIQGIDNPPTPPVNNVGKNRSACAPTTTPSSMDVITAIWQACDEDIDITDDDRTFIQTVAQIESNLDPYAKNPTSSATGLYQFLDALAVKYYGELGVPPTCANRCDPLIATRAMILFYKAEIKPYYQEFINTGKIAGKTPKNTDWSAQYAKLSSGDFMYGLVHHDGVGNAVKGKDLGGVDYWRKKVT